MYRSQEDESWDLLAMRLIEMYQLAYPKVSTEKSKELRDTFLDLISPSIKAKILDTERAVKVSRGGSGTRMKFSAIIELATELQGEQQHQEIEKQINWTRPTARVENLDRAPHEQYRRNRSPTFYNSNRSSSANNSYHRQGQTHHVMPQRQPGCSYCKKGNHERENCWRASKSCLICGRDHMIERCPRFDPNYNSGRNKYSSATNVQHNLNH